MPGRQWRACCPQIKNTESVLMSKKHVRKRAVADTRVQWTLAMRVVMHFGVFVCAGAIFGLINQFLVAPFAGIRENFAIFWGQSGPMLLALACLMPVFVRDTLTLTNRMAGPIHNLRETVKKLAAGEEDVRPLKFRDGDFWPDLPEMFNTMTERLRSDSTDVAPTTESQPAATRRAEVKLADVV